MDILKKYPNPLTYYKPSQLLLLSCAKENLLGPQITSTQGCTMNNVPNANGPAACTFEPSAIHYGPGENPCCTHTLTQGNLCTQGKSCTYTVPAVKYIQYNIEYYPWDKDWEGSLNTRVGLMFVYEIINFANSSIAHRVCSDSVLS